MNYRLMDLHNHTKWSDGLHSPKEIVENAIKNGIECIGISDHFATSKCNSIAVNKLDRYIRAIEKLKQIYGNEINIFSGVEICTREIWCDLKQLDPEMLNKLDYTLFEYVEGFSDSFTLKDLKDFRRKLSCRVGLAHTDPFMLMKKYDIGYVAKFLSEERIFWEINVNQGYEYFDELINNMDSHMVKNIFDEFKKNGVEITVGSDTHSLGWYDLGKLKLGNLFAQYKM